MILKPGKKIKIELLPNIVEKIIYLLINIKTAFCLRN